MNLNRKKNHHISLVLTSLFIVLGCAGIGDYSIDLPGRLKVNRISAENIVNSSHDGVGTTIIPAKIIQVGWDDDYVLAKQYDDANGNEYYWIINVHTEKTFGPLAYQEYLNKKDELDISKDIKLLDLDQFEKNYFE